MFHAVDGQTRAISAQTSTKMPTSMPLPSPSLTLITVGRHDELTPACAQTLRDGVAGAELRLFEHSSHVAHLEETDGYLEVVGDFLRRVDARHES